MDGWNTSFLLGLPIFRGYVSCRECNDMMFYCLKGWWMLIISNEAGGCSLPSLKVAVSLALNIGLPCNRATWVYHKPCPQMSTAFTQQLRRTVQLGRRSFAQSCSVPSLLSPRASVVAPPGTTEKATLPENYPENWHETWKSPNWKGKSSSKRQFFGSMLTFAGCSVGKVMVGRLIFLVRRWGDVSSLFLHCGKWSNPLRMIGCCI